MDEDFRSSMDHCAEPRTLLIVPALNEAANIARVLVDARCCLPGVDLLVIDDGSCDGTAAVARSAGAMVLCEHLNDPRGQGTTAGLGIVPGACVLPHHNTFGQGWADSLRTILPNATLVGIDEETAMISQGSAQHWRGYGAGDVTLYLPGHKLSHPQRFLAGQMLRLQPHD